MGDGFTLGCRVPGHRNDVEFDHVPITDQNFENALERARNGNRLSVDDAVELLTTGTEEPGIDHERKELVLEIADRRRAERHGDEVTFVANVSNTLTTACDTECLFCNFKDHEREFRTDSTGGEVVTKTPAQTRSAVTDAVERGVSEVTSTSGLHPALALDDEHRDLLEAHDDPDKINYVSPAAYETDPGTYVEQLRAMNVDGVHLHAITPEEAEHARRGTDWGYGDVYRRLADAGLNSVPGAAAEILVDEVREVICPEKITADQWMHAMEAAAATGLDITATIMYGHVENAMHRVLHLRSIRELQERTGAVTAFVPLSFAHENTPLYDRGYVDGGATAAEDELLMAVSRLFLDNVDHIQTSWSTFGDVRGLKMLTCGADDFMGTCLTGTPTRAESQGDEYRSFQEYVDMITAIGRTPVERSTDFEERQVIDPTDPPFGPVIGPRADGTPLVEST